MQIPKDQHTLSVKVIPRAKKTEFVGYMEDGTLKIRLRAVPEDGKANMELLRFLEEETEETWEIISGFTSQRK
jgi:uncharacterized protein